MSNKDSIIISAELYIQLLQEEVNRLREKVSDLEQDKTAVLKSASSRILDTCNSSDTYKADSE